MPKGLLGKKIGMTQYFDDAGKRIGVTVIEVPANRVLQVKTPDRDGYTALQLGIAPKKDKVASRPEIGHARAAGVDPCRFVREIRTHDLTAERGAEIRMDEVFAEGETVKITGTSKGKGFAGVMKRHNFGGYRATHGVKTHHRHPGAIGQCQDPGRVYKGKKMPGQMGNKRVTTKGLRIAKLVPEKNLLLIRGTVPGANGSFVTITADTGYLAPQA